VSEAGSLLLTPYDVLRLKRRLGLSSDDFLRDYTVLALHDEKKVPFLALHADGGGPEGCCFHGEEGCAVFPDRPWSCRIPSPCPHARHQPAGSEDLEAYERWGEAFRDLVLHEGMQRADGLSPEKLDMWFTACYDLDRFREFVLGSTLLQRFEVDEDLVEELRHDDEVLLRFAFQWLQFSLFGERTMKLRAGTVEAFQGREDRGATE